MFSKNDHRMKYEKWIDDYHKVLYQHAFWMTGREDVANELVQETYYQAWRSIRSLKDNTKALPWLFTILRRAIYQEQRYQYRHLETIAQLTILNEADYINDHHLLEIYSALESLSLKHREIFLLHHLHGYSYEQISEQLNIPKGTVMSRLSRARKALQELLEKTTFTSVYKMKSIKGKLIHNG